MKRLATLPPAFERFDRIGGALDFTIFEGAEGGDEAIAEAVGLALPRSKRFDPGRLRELGYRRINERALFGDWYDRPSGHLLRRGDFSTEDGRELKDPKLIALDREKIMSGGGVLPDAGTGGQLAYAFANPPHGLDASGIALQALFDEICGFILPPVSLERDIRLDQPAPSRGFRLFRGRDEMVGGVPLLDPCSGPPAPDDRRGVADGLGAGR